MEVKIIIPPEVVTWTVGGKDSPGVRGGSLKDIRGSEKLNPRDVNHTTRDGFGNHRTTISGGSLYQGRMDPRTMPRLDTRK